MYHLERGITTVHLKEDAPQIILNCEPLKSTKSASSYKVALPTDEVNYVYEPKIWPMGACVRG